MAGVDFESEAGLVDHYRRVRRKLLNARPGPVIVPAAVPQQAVVVSPLPEIAPAPEPEALPEPGPIIPPQTYPTLATVVRIVSKFYGIDPFDILGRSRAQPLCHRRHVAMYLCREMTKMSLPEIGRRMGGKDHTTILYGCKKIMANMESDDRLRSDIREMRNIIRRSSRKDRPYSFFAHAAPAPMTTMHEIGQMLWFETPRGQAIAKFMIERGPESDLEWVCFHLDGQIWTWINQDVRVARNITLGRDEIEQPSRRIPMPTKKEMAKFERSSFDKAKDRREAAKRGIPAAKFEGSAADKRMDMAAMRKMKKGKR